MFGEIETSFGLSRLQVALKSKKPFHVIQGIVHSNPDSFQRPDLQGLFPLHYAARHNASPDVVELLVQAHPAALEMHDYWYGRTPLHYAARKNMSEEAVRRLVEACPRTLFAKDNNGKLPADVVRQSNSAIATFLRRAMTEFKTMPALGPATPNEPQQPAGAIVAATPVEIDLDNHVPGGDRISPPALTRDLDRDRHRIRRAVEHPQHEPPALVSIAYVESIKTQKFLGEGFFGTVYKGSDPVLGREFAIKSINTEILRGGTTQELEDAMRTFQTEQAALSRFRHPNIAALYAYTDPLAEGSAAGYHLVYELAEKGSLDRYLEEDLGRSRLGSFHRRVQVAIDVMSALQFLHKGNGEFRTCFHRDVKSANIVLKRDFTAQLIDCGLAQFVNDDIKTTGIKGTKGYICLQYVQTGKYLPACDIYSFGVVLVELWTGRMQNQKLESGVEFNFGEEYIHEGRDVRGDADTAMDLGRPLPSFCSKFADLALHCISERAKHRPSGDEVLKALKAILEECSTSSDRLRVGSTVLVASGDTKLCSTCRTFNTVPQHRICALCLCREDIRKGFSDMASNSMRQPSVAPAMEELSKKIVSQLGNKLDPKLNAMSEKIDGVVTRFDAALPVLAHLDRRLNNQVPRTFVLLPADVLSGWKHPRSWLRSNVQKKYYLFFVCPVSQQVVSPPIKLKVAKDWFRKAAPVLASGLFLLQVGLKAGLNVNVDLDGTASELFRVSSDHVCQVLEELAAILKESGDDGLLERLRSGVNGGTSGGSNPVLSERDVRELSGDAYELVIEKACEQNGWRSQMEPVRLPPSPKVFWVAKAIAQDPKYQYEIVKA